MSEIKNRINKKADNKIVDLNKEILDIYNIIDRRTCKTCGKPFFGYLTDSHVYGVCKECYEKKNPNPKYLTNAEIVSLCKSQQDNLIYKCDICGETFRWWLVDDLVWKQSGFALKSTVCKSCFEKEVPNPKYFYTRPEPPITEHELLEYLKASPWKLLDLIEYITDMEWSF
jgi:DNA-directed RNA polymerase subunit RPC12/RpoP